MIEEFKDSGRAVAYLCLELGKHTHGPCAFVGWFPDGATKKRDILVDEAQLQRTLERLCRRFPEATVVLETGRTDLPVAAIQCHCPPSMRSACPNHCKHRDDRPIVCVTACSQTDQPSDEDMMKTLAAAHQLVEKSRLNRKKGRQKMHSYLERFL